MSIIDSISSIEIDTPIATMFPFDWTTNVVESSAELVIALSDIEVEFVTGKSAIKNHDKMKLNIELKQELRKGVRKYIT